MKLIKTIVSRHLSPGWLLVSLLFIPSLRVLGQTGEAMALPDGVQAVWDMEKAYRESTLTRERICINGLWRWQPAGVADNQPPAKDWGYFKVPGCWPGITDYMQKDSQTVYAHPSWKAQGLGTMTAAWYERTVQVPLEWTGRQIGLSVDYLNSYAAVFVDGRKRGEVHFPGGEIDLTAHVAPGRTHTITLLVVAMPLKGVLLSYSDSNSAREVKGKVERRGLCGDVFLVSTPAGPHIRDVKVDSSVRRSELTFTTQLDQIKTDSAYSLRAQVVQGNRPLRESDPITFKGGALKGGAISFTMPWKTDAFWDIHTASNRCMVKLSLADEKGRVLDISHPVVTGFREFWIDGRDFYLNGSRIFLCALPLDNAQIGAALSTYEAARESLARLKSIGINLVYTHNYGCEPGSHLSFDEILRAADDVGMLVSLSQPHFSHYDWRSPGADQTNGYARHAEFYARVAGNHPSVVAYSMSHNATGYEEDMNPDMIDGLHDPRDQWSRNNSKLALRAEAIVSKLDPARIVYHHASGNLASMHVINFYPNFAPVQELSDWFEHWATQGVKPVFTCEYGAPFTWDWTMYRGWYKGQRNFGSAEVPWEFCLAEWNSQMLGDRAYQISAAEAANLRWEAKQFRAGKGWHRWDYPYSVGSSAFAERYPIFATYFTDNWRAFRTWGVSGISPWEHEHFWKLREGVNKHRRDIKVDWNNLQRPGFSPDYLDKSYERMDLAFEREDWLPTAAAQALLRNNQPLLAYIAGKPEHFTSKDHVFFPGETVQKQLIAINNSRETVTCKCEWTFGPQNGSKSIQIKAGGQERLPLTIALSENQAVGNYELKARFRFGTGEIQEDSLALQVVALPVIPRLRGKIAVFDPKGETIELLKRMQASFHPVAADADLSGYDVLIVGKSALTTNGPAPKISFVRTGLKVLIFEQGPEALERRFGFRTAQYGLRQVFPRVPDHPILAGIGPDLLRDWSGEATILPGRLDYKLRPRYGPTVNWCDIPVTRLWRCGNRGNVASVLIEKPACGDFLPILDGGYSLQYSPLLEYREGQGMVLFCQVDVTGRTENDPVAQRLSVNLLQYVSDWEPVPARAAVYAGAPAGRKHLEAAGFTLSPYEPGKLLPSQVLVAGPGAETELGADGASVARWLAAGGQLVALGHDQASWDKTGLERAVFRKAEHISSFFEPPALRSPFRGIGPADLHNRDPRILPLVISPVPSPGDGILATASQDNIVFCQLLPWEFDSTTQSNLKRTYRRASFLLTRLLANLSVPSATPILERFHSPVEPASSEKRWLNGLYLDQPEEWDDPYRFFRW